MNSEALPRRASHNYEELSRLIESFRLQYNSLQKHLESLGMIDKVPSGESKRKGPARVKKGR